MINTFTEAVQTVDVEKAVGKPHALWVSFAKFYEDNDQLPEVGKYSSITTTGIPLEHNPNRVLNDIHRILIKLWL